MTEVKAITTRRLREGDDRAALTVTAGRLQVAVVLPTRRDADLVAHQVRVLSRGPEEPAKP